MKYTENHYTVAQNKCGLRVGDKVLVKRKARSLERGWGNCWLKSMDKFVGNIHKITSIVGSGGICLSGTWGYLFPYFVLEKVEKIKKPRRKSE
jgi:hypothetical protein